MTTTIEPGQVETITDDIIGQFRDASYEELMEQFARDLESDHQDNFDKQQSPSGQAWQPLSPVTVQKKGHSTILIDTDQMRSSLQGGHPNHYFTFDQPSDDLAIMGWGTSDEKAAIHQHGAGRIPARPFVGVNTDRVDQMAADAADATLDQLKET